MSDPTSGIIGDSSGIDLPEMAVDPTILREEEKMAKYARSAEFKRIKEHFEARIAFFQQFLPDGRPLSGIIPTPEQWLIANEVITEYNLVLNMFASAKQAVEDKNGLQTP